MGTVEFITNGEEETRAAAAEIAKRLNRGDVILYEGEMGAGKTAFTKGLAEYFGTDSEVTSPTFALVHEYTGRVSIFHFDLYRISGYDDLYAVGFFDYLDRGGIIAAEWSENVEGLEDELENVVKIRIDKLSENGRKITVTGERFGENAQT
ncbi:MAG: tRNA (adenosine(37)-N6)-threonylcarbamoyltransferase complex ATPase subunit type 1 TsaE [Oscillospiraceae bacterium]|nr:tRNA (adenosine(37)-N6)-threonylcarbamoyltransferase complex ATPase subunit type 1 TsaE [Oscillospiraceae bacterium]